MDESMKAPEKIYLNPDTVPRNQSRKFMFIHNSDIDESKCTIEYVRTDIFIEKAERYIRSVADGLDRDDDVEAFINGFKKYMKEE